MIKMIAANLIAIMLVILLTIISVLSISGSVDLRDSTTSLFVGSLVGNICGLLQAPLVWYFGQAIAKSNSPDNDLAPGEDK